MEDLNSSIPNWSLFETGHIQIQIFYDEVYRAYKAGLLIFLQDDEDPEIESPYNITLMTHLIHADKTQLSKMAFIYASTLFPNIDPMVKVWNEDVTGFEDIDLRVQKMTPEGYAVH